MDKKTASEMMLGGTSRNEDTDMSEIYNKSILQRKITDISQDFINAVGQLGVSVGGQIACYKNNNSSQH